jgi:hypothetical protein
MSSPPVRFGDIELSQDEQSDNQSAITDTATRSPLDLSINVIDTSLEAYNSPLIDSKLILRDECSS